MKRILIVDDEQSMRELLAILLKKEGFEVLAAASRAEAAAALAKSPVDLVLTDVRLPDGDGLEVLRHVKAASPATAVIVMTAYGTEMQADRIALEMKIVDKETVAQRYLTRWGESWEEIEQRLEEEQHDAQEKI